MSWSGFIQGALLLVLLPIIGLGRPEHAWVLLLLPVVWIIGWRVDRKVLPETPLNIPLLLISLSIFISLFATYDLRVSYPNIAELLYGLAVYWWLARKITTKRSWRTAVITFTLWGACIGVVALLGASWPNKLPLLGSLASRLPQQLIVFPRDEGGGIHPNGVAGTLLWMVPLSLSITPSIWMETVHTKQNQLLVRLVVAIFFTLGVVLFPLTLLLLSQSRGGLLGLAVAGALLIIRAIPKRLRWLIFLFSIVAIVAILLLWINSEATRQYQELYPRALSKDTLEWRRIVWSKAFMGIADFPLTGMGMNVFHKAFHVLYPTALISPIVDISNAHNLFLQVALDLGLPGLVGYIALWIGVFIMIRNSLKYEDIDTSFSFDRAAWIGLAAALLGFLVWGITDAVPLGTPPDFLWLAEISLVACGYMCLKRNTVSLVES
jgi:putative inorganic carbon (HCO3(-)) transporter